jgi:hypothetical protein
MIDVHKGGIQGGPRTPLLDELLEVELLLGSGELPRTVVNRIERDGVGVGSARHSSRGEE